MSRSIHTTRRALRNARRWRYADPQQGADEIQRLRKTYAQKRQIKATLTARRRAAIPAHIMFDYATIPIRCQDESALIHYPASVDDIRQVLARLPAGVLDGLTALTLSLGKALQLVGADEYDERDPLLERFGEERLPGVYSGRILGQYSWQAAINIFAYVYVAPLAPHWECYLRLRMLATLVHEIAHHDDHMRRIARGRWLARDKTKNEIYAQSWEYQWLHSVVVPYIQETYPTAIDALNDWMHATIGVVLPLAVLAGDIRFATKGDKYNAQALWGGTGVAFEEFVRDILAGEPALQTRLQLAKGLHRNEAYAAALAVFDCILAEVPDHVTALVDKAFLCRELEQYATAHALLAHALTVDVSAGNAWEELARLSLATGEWHAAVTAAGKALSLCANTIDRITALELHGNANIAIGDKAALQADIAALEQIGTHGTVARAASLRQRWQARDTHQSFSGNPPA